MPSPRLLRNAHTMKQRSTWRPIFSESLHFKRSVVLPNHIFIAFNYQIYKLLVLKFYLTENNNVIDDYDRPRLIKMANVSPP